MIPFGALAGPIISVLGEAAAVTVTRRAVGSYVGGLWVPGALSTFSLDAHVQPADQRLLNKLPEGERTEESIAVYSADPLLVSDVTDRVESDLVTYQGKSFRVRVIENWGAQAGYYLALCVRVTE